MAPRAWVVLVAGVVAQALATVVVTAPAFLIPLLVEQGMPLPQAGMLAAAPNLGLVLTLVAWGAVADRFGERWVIVAGLGLTGAFTLLAATAGGFVALGALLALAGAASGSINSASGRVVVGWFPRHRRGLAMGIRQCAQPLGMAAAALMVPTLARDFGIPAPLLVAGAAAAVAAIGCAFAIRNPPPQPAPEAVPASAPNPYRESSFLWRIHAVSALLVIPQFTLSTFGLLWLISGLGLGAATAGVLMAVAQVIGGLGRIAMGYRSDFAQHRVKVLRGVAIAAIVCMLLLAGAAEVRLVVVGSLIFILATAVSVADNGLEFTSVAEAAGPRWSGRALGVQNTGQFIAGSAVGPVVGALIAGIGFPLTYLIVAAAPLLSVPLIPRADRNA
ncbi:MFS transporter [Brevibacterium daeguense]|uniref:MFS transporter n=1 Tax=Brevibacterium daeguense TaxID=909936 RepID=A0ABP8EIG5_9MICO